MGDPEGLNIHSHSEQPQPQESCVLMHISLRLITSLAHAAIWCGYALVENGITLPFSSATATTKAVFFPARFCTSRQFLNTPQTELNTEGPNISARKGWLSVGYPTLARITILIQGHPRIVE
jgi:hypothetical protein